MKTKDTKTTSEGLTPKTLTFKELGLSRNMITHLDTVNFKHPSEIQEKTIPLILQNSKDVIGIAQTGTGKTAAFALPIIDLISTEYSKHKHFKIIKAILLAPTRELALQVTKEISTFSAYKKLDVLTVYGGAPIQKQIQSLKKGVDIVVGTPGRVVDLIQRRALDISSCFYVVLDEADEMLKMGFVEDLEFILSHIPNKRRVYLFSATMPNAIKELSKKYMKKQIIVEVQKKVEVSNLISQEYFFVQQGRKFELLVEYLQSLHQFHSIIFCRTKADVDNVTNLLKNQQRQHTISCKVDCIHGDISQNRREKILQDFKHKRLDILVATDVAARGIHVDNVSHVINYTLPLDIETYTHRIGRTGRAGNNGVALSFVTKQQLRTLRTIEKELGVEVVEKKPLSKREIEEIKQHQIEDTISTLILKSTINNSNNTKHTNSDTSSNDTKNNNKRENQADKIITTLLKKFSSEQIIRALVLEKLPNIYENNTKRKSEDHTLRKKSNISVSQNGTVRVFVAKGKKDKLHKKTLIHFLEKDSGISLKQVSDVKICDAFSFISMKGTIAKELIEYYNTNSKSKRPLVELASQ